MESTLIKFTVYGEPQPWKRPRFNGKNKIVFEDPKVTAYKDKVIKAYAESGKYKKFEKDVPLRCEVYFWLGVPKSASEKKKLEMACDGRPTKRPDNDNLYKGITDALNGVAYHDDSQIVDTAIHKLWTMGEPRAEIEIRELFL